MAKFTLGCKVDSLVVLLHDITHINSKLRNMTSMSQLIGEWRGVGHGLYLHPCQCKGIHKQLLQRLEIIYCKLFLQQIKSFLEISSGHM